MIKIVIHENNKCMYMMINNRVLVASYSLPLLLSLLSVTIHFIYFQSPLRMCMSEEMHSLFCVSP